MSFWDHIKPAEREPRVVDVSLSEDRRTVSLAWDDGLRSQVSARTLRQRCPCAACVDEWSNTRTLDPDAVPEALTVFDVTPVGNYALAFAFSDAHRTGIFSWRSLRAAS